MKHTSLLKNCNKANTWELDTHRMCVVFELTTQIKTETRVKQTKKMLSRFRKAA